MSLSPAQRLLELPRSERRKILASYGDDGLAGLERDWRFWARPEQLAPPGSWTVWAMSTGRGYGKTRSGAEFVLDRSEKFASYGARHRVLLVGKTAADCRDVQVEGESGLIACGERRGYTVKYEPSKRRVTIPELDTTGTTFSAEKPDQLRGHQGHTGWADEVAAWKLLVDREGNTAWSNLMLALRLEGVIPAAWFDDLELDDEYEFEAAPAELQPQVAATTTPKPIALIKDWIKRASSGDPSIRVTTGSMMENVANLAPRFVEEVMARYAGSRLGAQEIEGLLLDAVEGALWTPELFERWRVHSRDQVPDLSRKVIGVDPSGSGPHGDDCGIVVAGVEANPANPLRRHFYVLDDLSSNQRPEVWAKIVVDAYWREDAAAVVAERNFGHLLVEDVIHLTDPNVPVELVNASRGKVPRAEPVALLWDQGRGHTVGYFGQLEAECCTYVTDEGLPSPNVMDAMVWAAHYLLPEIGRGPASQLSPAEIRLPTGAEAMVRSETDPFGGGSMGGGFEGFGT